MYTLLCTLKPAPLFLWQRRRQYVMVEEMLVGANGSIPADYKFYMVKLATVRNDGTVHDQRQVSAVGTNPMSHS